MRIVAIAGCPRASIEAGLRCRTKRTQFAAPAEQSRACGLSRLQGALASRWGPGHAAEQSEPNSPRLPNQADRTNRTQRSRSRGRAGGRAPLPNKAGPAGCRDRRAPRRLDGGRARCRTKQSQFAAPAAQSQAQTEPDVLDLEANPRIVPFSSVAPTRTHTDADRGAGASS